MEILGSLATAGANGNDTFRLTSWKKGMQGEGVMLDIQMPVVVGTGGTPATSDLVNLLNYFLAQFSLAYGPSQNYKAFEGILGSELRNIFRFLSLKEVANNFVGVVQTTGAKTFGVQLIYLFNPVYSSGRSKRPGHSVCRTIRLDVTEGNALTAGALNLTRGASACTIAVVPLYRKGRDNLIHLPCYRRINQSKLDVETPDGLVLGAWDDNAAFGSTAIGKYAVRIGDDDIIINTPPLYENDAYSALIDAGGSNMTDAETLLYFVDPFDNPEHWPHGRLYLKLISQDVSTIKLRTLFYPEMDESQVAEFTGAIAKESKTPVLATTPASDTQDPHPGAASVGPHELVTAAENGFQSAPGVLGTTDGQTMLSIPAHVIAAAHAAVGSAHADSKSAVASQAVHHVARRVPGSIGTNGKRRGGALGAQGIHAHFAGLGPLNDSHS